MFGPQLKYKNTAVFISGGGSTLQALLEQQHQIQISVVISSKKKALGLLKAKRFGIPTEVLSHPVDWFQLHQSLVDRNISQIVLCGFMKIVPASFLELWHGRIFNIHPSLLPLHKGLEAAEKSWNAQDPMGVSIHHVIDGVDEGQLILQMKSVTTKEINLTDSMLFIRSREQMILRELSTGWMI